MRTRSGRRYHPYSGRPKRASYRRTKTRGTQTPASRRAPARAATSKYGKAISVNFRTKKTSLRQYRNTLWKDTLFMTHYRSVAQSTATTVPPSVGTPGAANVYIGPALSTNSFAAPFVANPFWTATGGTQAVDAGAGVPVFSGDITLRGGIVRLSIYNNDDVQMRLRVYGVWAAKNPSFAVYTALAASARPVEWDPSMVSEFSTEFGRILFNREATVNPGENIEVLHRFKPQKIDKVRFTGVAGDPAGSQLWWMIALVPTTANAAAVGLTVVSSWNLSFAADVVS